jgi:hypothetical protein
MSDDIELEIDQLMLKFPDEDLNGGTNALEYTVQHPFVRPEECHRCMDIPCTCPDADEKTVWYECRLCERADMTEMEAKCHLREPSHLEKMEVASATYIRYKHKLGNMIELFDDSRFKRLKREDSRSLPDNVLASVYRCIMFDAPHDLTQYMATDEAAIVLEKYENMERLAVLHLAVWKAECLSQMPAVVYTLSSAQEWMTKGWKDCKAEHGKSGAMHTIVSLVLPFL